MGSTLHENSLHCTYSAFMWYIIRFIFRHFFRLSCFLALDSRNEQQNNICFCLSDFGLITEYEKNE